MGDSRHDVSTHKNGRSDLETQLMEWRSNLKKAAHNLLKNNLKRRADTSDIVQEGMIQIWQTKESFYGDSYGEKDHLTKKIAKGQATKLVRRHYAKKRSLARTESTPGTEFSVSCDPAKQCEADEMLTRVMTALQQLEFKYQEVLYMLFFEDCSLSETSRRLGKTAKVVKRLYRQSLQELQSKVGPNH